MPSAPLDLGQLTEDATYDLIVVGAGGGGMAAALFGAIAGLKVLLVERTEFVGGTTALSAGTAWIPNTHVRPDAVGPERAADSLEKASRYLDLAVGTHSRPELRRAFLENGPKAVAVLERHSELRFRARPFHPDYLSELEGSTLCGRAIEPLPFDGRKLGSSFALLRPPIPEFTILGGMMVDRDDIGHLLNLTKSIRSLGHGMKLVLRHALDRVRHPRGTRLVMGNALVGRLLFSLLQKGVDLLLQAKVEEIVRDGGDDGGTVTGLLVSQGSSKRRITARRGVILASGGFSRHPRLRGTLLNEPVPAQSPLAPGVTGEMHDLLFGLGARYGTGGLDNAFWAPVSVRRRADGTTAVFPHFVMDRGKPGIVTVNKKGERFVNEAISYHPFGRAMFAANRTAPSIPAFLIADAAALRRYGMGMVRPGGRGLAPFLADGYLVQGASLGELARKLDIDAEGLERTVAAVNRYAEEGSDPVFGRGGTVYNRANGDASRKPNPNLGPLTEAPFYALRLYPGDIGASTGFATDADARVLDPDGQPIPGLYACGNDMHSVMGGVYPGPGITIGPALTFAYVAARHASGGAVGLG